MACKACSTLRQAAVQAIRRGQVRTAGAIVARGAKQIAKTPPLIKRR